MLVCVCFRRLLTESLVLLDVRLLPLVLRRGVGQQVDARAVEVDGTQSEIKSIYSSDIHYLRLIALTLASLARSDQP